MAIVPEGVDVGVGEGTDDGTGVGVGATVGDALAVGAGVGLGVGTTVAVGVGFGDGVAVDVAVEDGVAVGVGDGVAVGVGVGWATSSSPGSVAWSRYPAVPVPLLSRWPRGPTAVTTSPVWTVAPASEFAVATIRRPPEPSSTVMPRPSASALGASATVPSTRSRRPSSGSPAPPVVEPRGSGRLAAASCTTAVDVVFSVLRLKYVPRVPVAVRVVPAGIGVGSATSSRIAIPAVGSWTNPIRAESIAPRSVVRTPEIVTEVPSGIDRASAIATIVGGVGVASGVALTVGVGVGATVGVGVAVDVGVGATVGVGVVVDVGVGATVGVGVGTGDGLGDGAGLTVGVGSRLGEGEISPVGVGVGLGVAVAVGVGVGSGVGVGVGVGVAGGDELVDGGGVAVAAGVGEPVAIGVGVGPPVGVGAAARFCGFGVATTKSAALALVSVPLPAAPPGSRSMLDPAAGAIAGDPSTNAFVASPHATASIGLPPITRRTTAPPVAAKPDEYVASAIAAWIPAALAMRRWLPGCSTVGVAQVALRVTVEPVEVT
jgi:hypothetical protein